MKYRWLTIIVLIGLVVNSTYAESVSDLQKQVSRRYSTIGIHNMGAAIDIAGWQNVAWGVRASYEIGSVRNVVNGTIDVGYRMLIPTQQPYADWLGHYLPIALGIKCNYYSWELNSAYIGAEGCYNIHLDKKSPLYQSFFAATGKLGLRFKMLDISVNYTYDFAPAFNQKYIYETQGFNFEALHATIYERMQIGMRIAYYFTFGL